MKTEAGRNQEILLDQYIKDELKKVRNRDWEVWSFEDDLYEIIESFDQIIYMIQHPINFLYIH